jgi:DNA-directed RNA polymerase subunit alpha
MEYYNNKALEVILKYQEKSDKNIVILNDYQKYIAKILLELKEENKSLREDLSLVKSVFNINNELVVRKTNDSVTMRKTDAEMIDLLNSKLSRFDLSNRCYNKLTYVANVKTIADLVQMTKQDVLKIRLFGKKCFAELEQELEYHNLYFEMDISRYKPYLELNTK